MKISPQVFTICCLTVFQLWGDQHEARAQSLCYLPTPSQKEIGWTSSCGVRLWNSDIPRDKNPQFLGEIIDRNWENAALEWIPGTPHVVYCSPSGLRVWNLETNQQEGIYNNADGDWSKVQGIALHPEDSTKIIWTTPEGLKIWCTIGNEDLGPFNRSTKDWTQCSIANHPVHSEKLIFMGRSPDMEPWHPRVWNLLTRSDEGAFGEIIPGWKPVHRLTRVPTQLAGANNTPLKLSTRGNRHFLTFPTERGGTYQVQRGDGFATLSDIVEPFVAKGEITTIPIPPPRSNFESLYRVSLLSIVHDPHHHDEREQNRSREPIHDHKYPRPERRR